MGLLLIQLWFFSWIVLLEAGEDDTQIVTKLYNCSRGDISPQRRLKKLRELSNGQFYGANSVIKMSDVECFFKAYCYRYTDLPRQVKPETTNEGSPVIVKVGVIVEDISSIHTSHYVGNFYITLSWNDTDLKHPFQNIYINEDRIIQKMWLPAFLVANAADTAPGQFLRKNHYVEIKQSGEVIYRTRLEITAVCKMKFALYPFDTQNCGLELASYAYPPEQMKLIWAEHGQEEEHDGYISHTKYSIFVEKDIDFIQFGMYKVVAKNVSTVQEMGNNLTRLAFRMVWRRRLLYHFIYTFLPSFFMVLVSYLTFFLDASALMPRIAMNITTMLTLQTLSSSLGRSLPPVSYLKAIDTWIIGCNVLIVGALVEFIAANFLHRDVFNISWKQLKKSRIADLEPAEGERSPAEIAGQRALAHIVDKASRVIFLVVYVVCIILFWSVYPAKYYGYKIGDDWTE